MLFKPKSHIFNLVNKYADIKYQDKIFEPNKSFIPVSGKVIDHSEIKLMVTDREFFVCNHHCFTILPKKANFN